MADAAKWDTTMEEKARRFDAAVGRMDRNNAAIEATLAELQAAVRRIKGSPVAAVTKELEQLPALREALLAATRPSVDLEIKRMEAEAQIAKLGLLAEVVKEVGPGVKALLMDKRVSESIASHFGTTAAEVATAVGAAASEEA